MLRTCGQYVDDLLIRHRETLGKVSTRFMSNRHITPGRGVQHQVIPSFLPLLPPLLSPRIFAGLPLIEHYLYPVSTVPIINSIKEN
jgi:hypothetical protein